MSFISNNITNNIKPSITLLIDAKAKELKGKGFEVISLGVGEPDFDTPLNIKQAAIKAIENGYTKYTAAGGALELKKAIIGKFKRENNLDYSLNQVMVSSGAKQVIYNALMATLNPGDEVITLAPYWVSYPEMIKIAGGKPVIVETNFDDNFSINIENIEQAISPNTKWIILNSPNNPCGSVYSKQELIKLAEMLAKYPHVHILCDDIYEHLLYNNEKFFNLAEVVPHLKDRILIVNGVSKAYAMTGWRIGYAAGNEELIKAMGVVQSQSTSGACSISQMAAVEALNGPQDFISSHKQIFQNRRNFMVEKINSIRGLSCLSPKGAFYLFINCQKLLNSKTTEGELITNSADFVNYLMDRALVATVSGSSFGAEGYFRISYATSEKNLAQAVDRIKKACEELQPNG